MIIASANRLNSLEEYYFSKKLDEIRLLNQKGYDIINLGIGSPDLKPSENTIQALIQSAEKPGNHGYQPYKGTAELRTAISGWYKSTYSVFLNPDNEILPLMGSKEGITHISLAFLNPGDKVLIPELGYPAYKAVTNMVGAEVIPYRLDPVTWFPDFNFLEQVNPEGVKLLWLNYPHMPTGAIPTREMFEKLVNWAKKNKVLLCHDNPYSLVLNESPPISLLSVPGAMEAGIELNSMSKSHNMAGWRIGWVGGDREYINAILKIKSNVDSGMFRGIQDAAVEALKNPPEWHMERNDIYRKRRIKVWELLDLLGCSYTRNQVGLFVWARIPENIDSVEKWVDHILYNQKVFITPGFIFGEKGDRYVRMSLCAEVSIFNKAIDRLKNLNYK